jgi:hypothetical protein
VFKASLRWGFFYLKYLKKCKKVFIINYYLIKCEKEAKNEIYGLLD